MSSGRIEGMGGTISDHERRAARAGLKTFIAVVSDVPTPPAELAYLLVWYSMLRKRNPLGMQAEPMPFSEIEAFARCFPSFEVDEFDTLMLTELDDVWLAALPKAS